MKISIGWLGRFDPALAELLQSYRAYKTIGDGAYFAPGRRR